LNVDVFGIVFLVAGIPITLVTAVYAHSMFLYARGDLAQQKGNLEKSRDYFLKAATGLNPIGRGIAYAGLARVYLRLNQPDEALAALRQTLQRARSPGVIMAAYQLFSDATLNPHLQAAPATVLEEAERLVAATGMAKSLKAIAYAQFSGAYYRLGQFAEARRVAGVALEADPLNTTALFTLGWLDMAYGDLKAARERFIVLNNVSQKDQRPLGIYGLGAIAFYEGDLTEAESVFERAAREGGKILEPFAHSRRVMSLALAGKNSAESLAAAERTTAELRARGSLTSQSSIEWLLAMAKAFSDGNPALAREAAAKAPAEERAEAEALADALPMGKCAAGWLKNSTATALA
jgi:tetratricopeptide (TPR) repeat protein